ncbi:YfiR family protein [Rhodoferax sp. WC2427]|uniref:YfiR family protein n=1 Tax=Rhodoferax sp. WC2427 TaxID=3234144 RepID=UPI003466D4AC
MKRAIVFSTMLRTLLGCAMFAMGGLALAQQGGAAPPVAVERVGVTETLLGILSYARWPNESSPLRVCIAGRSTHADPWLKNGLAALAQRPIVVQALAPNSDAPIAAQCDALYIGSLDDATSRRIFSTVVGYPVLTVSERVPPCAAGAMVCLDANNPSGVQFEVNLDAVARSGVRVNPQVLRLGRPSGKIAP